jgi:hypothetical protein
MMLRDTIGKLVKLVYKSADVDTAHRIRLREWHCLWKALPMTNKHRDMAATINSHGKRLHLACCQPTNAGDLIEFFLIVDHHRLIVVFGYNLGVSYASQRLPT